jgi:PAS domain S-box-containing protein
LPGNWFLIRQDGSFEYVNEQACAGLGYTRAELSRATIFDLDPNVTRQAWAALWQDTAPKDPRVVRSHHVRKDGTRMPVEVRACRATIEGREYAASYVIDLTANEQLRMELSSTEEQLRRLIAHLPDIVFRLSLEPELKLEFISPACVNVLGYSPQELLAEPTLLGRVFEEDRATLLKLGSAQPGAGQKLRWLHKDGALVWLDVRASRVASTRPGSVVVEGVARDVTRSQHLEAELARGQKMKALGQLAGGIAHDFNNLLQVIRASAQVLETLRPSTEAIPLLSEISAASERAASLVRQLLTFSRQGSVEFTDLDLASVVSKLHQMLERLLGEHIELVSTSHEGSTWVCGNQAQLEQIIVNLCVNARDAMPHGGKLEIGVRVRGQGTLFERTLERDHVELWVSDTGEGMSEEVQQALFEPFFTTKEPGRGNGLGLATVYAAVQSHGGFIRVESTQGAGSTFRVLLPRTEPPEIPGVPHSGAPLLRGDGLTVLVAEDEPVVRELTARQLREAGFSVLTASDGEQAERVLEEQGSRIALVVLDAVMPRMTGGALLSRLRERGNGVPVLFVTAYDYETLADLRGDTRVAILSKPFAREQLLEQAGRLLRGARVDPSR